MMWWNLLAQAATAGDPVDWAALTVPDDPPLQYKGDVSHGPLVVSALPYQCYRESVCSRWLCMPPHVSTHQFENLCVCSIIGLHHYILCHAICRMF